MNNKHITRFGDPTTLSGARYVVFDSEGLLQMAVDLENARLYNDGVPFTPKFKELILDRVQRDFGILASKIGAEGIPPNLQSLFSFAKKSRVEKYVKRISVSEFELFLLIYNCKQLGFSHRSKFPEYIPSHLIITDNDREGLFKKRVWPFVKKIKSISLQRKKIHVHLFERGIEWHCFYFSYNDIEVENTNHFIGGSHFHYVSHLWGYDKEKIWGKFDTRFTSMGDFHVKFLPFDYSKSQLLSKKMQVDFAQKPMLAAINTDLPANRNSIPIPLAQITTRGFWAADIAKRKE